MNKVVVIRMIAALLSSRVLAEFKIEKGVYRIDDLKSAQAKAKSEGKPITFLLSDEHTTCGLCTAASENVLHTLKHNSVIVYANAESDWKNLPGVVQKALGQPEAGKYIPKTVIVDPGMTNVVSIVPYELGPAQDKLLKKAKKDIAAMPETDRATKPLSSGGKPSLPLLQPDENREMRIWTRKNGAEVKAAAVRETGGYLVLKKEDGARVQVLMSQLSDMDQEYVAGLKEDVPKNDQQRRWTN